MTPLDRAFTLVEVVRIALAVADQLYLDVAGSCEFLDEAGRRQRLF
jgi:hypothetical protein